MTPSSNDEPSTREIPGWGRPAWAVRGHKVGPELTGPEASIDVTYQDGGVEETFARELVRTDQVAIDETLGGCVSGIQERGPINPVLRAQYRCVGWADISGRRHLHRRHRGEDP